MRSSADKNHVVPQHSKLYSKHSRTMSTMVFVFSERVLSPRTGIRQKLLNDPDSVITFTVLCNRSEMVNPVILKELHKMMHLLDI